MDWLTRERAGVGLAVARTLAGAAAWLAPEVSARALSIGRGNEPVSFALRLFGARDLAIGLAYLTARPEERRRWLQIGMVVDGADAAAALIAGRRAALDTRTTVGTAATALGAVVTAAWARQR